MRWTLRILMLLHIGFILFGVYSVLFQAEYVHASKYVFVGLTGFFLFLNAFLLIPLKFWPNKILMVCSLVLYMITVMSFWSPDILKNQWEWLISATIIVVLNSLFVRLIKSKKKWESWFFPIVSILIVLPFVLIQPSFGAMLLSTILLAFLSVYLLFKVVKN